MFMAHFSGVHRVKKRKLEIDVFCFCFRFVVVDDHVVIIVGVEVVPIII